jgi:hypothetical protein
MARVENFRTCAIRIAWGVEPGHDCERGGRGCLDEVVMMVADEDLFSASAATAFPALFNDSVKAQKTCRFENGIGMGKGKTPSERGSSKHDANLLEHRSMAAVKKQLRKIRKSFPAPFAFSAGH